MDMSGSNYLNLLPMLIFLIKIIELQYTVCKSYLGLLYIKAAFKNKIISMKAKFSPQILIKIKIKGKLFEPIIYVNICHKNNLIIVLLTKCILGTSNSTLLSLNRTLTVTTYMSWPLKKRVVRGTAYTILLILWILSDSYFKSFLTVCFTKKCSSIIRGLHCTVRNCNWLLLSLLFDRKIQPTKTLNMLFLYVGFIVLKKFP